MKKYLIIIFALLALSGYSQQDLKARYMNVTRMLYSGIDSLISPADTLHQFNYMKMKDPVLSLDGVNKRSMERLVGDTAKLLHWADTIPTTGARIATGDDIKSMIDGSGTASFVPKFSDANTLTNSVFKDDGIIATIEQNSKQPFTSVLSGAVDNTLYLEGGKVGILTSTPDALLTLRKSVAASESIGSLNNPQIFIRNGNALAYNEKAEVNFSIGSQNYTTAGITALYTRYNSDTDMGSDLIFNTRYSAAKGGLLERVRITNLGNIVIGATSTTSKFDVQALGSTNPIATFSNDKDAAKDSTVVISKLGGLTTSYNLGVRTTLADNPLTVNCGTTGGFELDYNDPDGSAANKVVYGVTSSGDATITPSGGDVVISGRITTTQITAALTDNTPTDAEIDAATSLTPSTAGAGWQCTIKDNNGSGLLYKVESDGTDWYYIALTKAL